MTFFVLTVVIASAVCGASAATRLKLLVLATDSLVVGASFAVRNRFCVLLIDSLVVGASVQVRESDAPPACLISSVKHIHWLVGLMPLSVSAENDVLPLPLSTPFALAVAVRLVRVAVLPLIPAPVALLAQPNPATQLEPLVTSIVSAG
ncbi:MAG TPA: hypothetical protein VKE42_06370 [Candidatus Cybelea sp.]|nr:hypothetical protein [Candidatus Cybelea sp.]